MLRIVVPARLESSRLPEKMLRVIGRKTVIEHSVARILAAAGARNVVVVTDSGQIASLVSPACQIIVHNAPFRSGTDRVAFAADTLGFAEDDIVVNVQADMPFLNPGHLADFFIAAEQIQPGYDMLTASVDVPIVRAGFGYFKRDHVRCHVGLYAYRRPALRAFAAAPTSPAETLDRLEQHRAREIGLRIELVSFPEMPLEINTQDDLHAARHLVTCLA